MSVTVNGFLDISLRIFLDKRYVRYYEEGLRAENTVKTILSVVRFSLEQFECFRSTVLCGTYIIILSYLDMYADRLVFDLVKHDYIRFSRLLEDSRI
jgi:hypothetical protein